MKAHKEALKGAANKAKKMGLVTSKGKIIRKKQVKRQPQILTKKGNRKYALVFRKLSKEQQEYMKEYIKKRDGEVDVWVHPFSATGDIERRGFDGRFASKKPQKEADKAKLKAIKNTFRYLRMTDKPLFVFVENARGKTRQSIQELFTGFGIKRPVIFVETGYATPFQERTEKHLKEKYNYKYTDEIHPIEKKMGKQIADKMSGLGIQKANIFGEEYYEGEKVRDSGCAGAVDYTLKKLGNKPIKTEIKKELAYGMPEKRELLDMLKILKKYV